MKTNSKSLIRELTAIVEEDLKLVGDLGKLPGEILSRKPSIDSWSALECLEHLNLYSSYYLTETSEAIRKMETAHNPVFKSGIMGNYLVGMVQIKAGCKKMKTFAAMNPDGKQLGNEVITRFIKNQEQLKTLLQEAESSDINKGKISVTFSKFVKLKIGDILRFMAYHNQRHIQQALRACGQ